MYRFIGILCGIWMMLGAVSAETVSGVTYVVSGQETHISVHMLNAATPPKIFQLGGDSPRVVLDWENAAIGASLPQSQPSVSAHVKGLRHAQHGENGVRLVFDLENGASLLSHALAPGTVNLQIQGITMVQSRGAPPAQAAPPATTQIASRYFDNQVPHPRLKPSGFSAHVKMIAKPKKPIIVIDAGHGGRDPGSIGKRQGTYEKIITLKASKELRTQLLATGRYDVIMTRSGDSYVDHEERIRIARAGGGDLFISIHADSTKTSTARGASVYTLADRAKNRTKEIINTQNWVMDVDLTEQSDPVGDILVDLAQRKTISQSTKFADALIDQLSGSTRLIGNTHRRAGYFVLLAPDVPAVLLELGFLSNSHDEVLLRSPSHRKKMMGSVVTAINGYFDNQKP